MKHQLDATLCRFYFCGVTLHVSALIRRCDDLPATITHVPVAAVLVLNTPDDGRLRPKHVEWICRNKTCIVLHQVGVSFDLEIPGNSCTGGWVDIRSDLDGNGKSPLQRDPIPGPSSPYKVALPYVDHQKSLLDWNIHTKITVVLMDRGAFFIVE